MSSKKRRIKRKIAMLVRMDHSFYIKRYRMTDKQAAERTANMRALGRKLGQMGYEAVSREAITEGRNARGQYIKNYQRSI